MRPVCNNGIMDAQRHMQEHLIGGMALHLQCTIHCIILKNTPAAPLYQKPLILQ
jgi:hypothetical protein